jgi:uncharacterized repeat protein (TIGR01451 family)/fimbrial isopeptide formation D2 family protein
VESPTTVLYGAPASVTLQASNPSGTYGYNLSYRAVLPAGVSYRSASGRAGGDALAPQVIANEPTTGETTLIWSNVQDLSPSSHGSLSFEVEHSTSHFKVGESYTVQAGAYIASEPRFLPRFSAAGVPEGPSSTSYTGFATASAKTTLSALEITQSEPSPKGEILRGVHDHQVEYTVVVRNTSVNSTSGATVSEWLPAGLEYLGCGGSGMDHTTDAPTNPGTREEYPGSGLIEAAALSGCQAASSTATVKTDPDGTGPDQEAMYTHVQWTLGTIAAGGTVTLHFLAAVPLRENTLTWSKSQPSTSGEAQAADLDNNSGPETRDGQTLTTYATAAGVYAGTLPVSAENYLTRTAKDMIVEKAASSGTLEVGQVVHWTLTIRSSEYRYNTGITVTDTLPSGLCPLGPRNYTSGSQPSDSECESTVKAEDEPSSSYLSAAENANGTWTLTWDDTTDSALANLQADEVTTITFATRTRSHYQENHTDAKPILANDSVSNSVAGQATTNVVCEAHYDCSAPGATPIDHERPLSETISDSAAVALSAGGPSIAKQIAAASNATCTGITYTSAIPVYHPGDQVCWKLSVSFPELLSTQGEQITDFLPLSAIFDPAFEGGSGERAEPADTLAASTFYDAEAGTTPGGTVRWTLPEGGTVKEGGQRFERVIQTSTTLVKGATPGELQGNLMKFANVNTQAESFSERAEADYALQFPELTLEKKIVALNGTPEGTPASAAIIDGGASATFQLTVKNLGEVEADHAVVIDELPAGLTCADVRSISNSGACEGTGGAEYLIWGETGLGTHTTLAIPSKGQASVQFEIEVPAPTDPGRIFEDQAGVKSYESATNTGGQFVYVPEDNIDPLRESEPLNENEAHVTPARASARLEVENVQMSKTHTTAVNETGNDAEQATIGEQTEYEVSAAIPSGTSLASEAVLSDPSLKAEGLEYVAGSAKAYVDGSEAPSSEYTVSEPESGGAGTGRVPTVSLPAGVTPPAHAPLTVTLKFQAHVANVEANRNAARIKNTGKLTWKNSLGENRTATASNELPIVEPDIKLTEEDNAGGPVKGGQEVEYKLHAKDEATASAANDVKLVEKVAAGVTPLKEAGGAPLANHEKLANGGEWIEAAPGGPYAGEIVWELAKLTPGQEQSYSYFVKVEDSPSASAHLTDKATVTVTSLPTSEGEGRTAADAPGTTKARYEASTEKALEVQQMTIVKGVQPEAATIGQHVAYSLTVTLPAHVSSYDTTVFDKLPDSLDFDRFLSAECTGGCTSAPLTIRPYLPSIGEGPTTLAWSIGEVAASSEARTVKIEYEADVRATHHTAPHAEVKTPLTIENEARVSYDQKGPERPLEEATIPSGLEKSTGTVHKDVTLFEPKLKLTKEVSTNSGASFSAGPADVSDSQKLIYRIKVTNEGNGPGYGVEVSDPLPATLIEAKATSGTPQHAWTASEPEFIWTSETLAAGATLTYEYEARVTTAKNLEPDEKIENTATLAGYHGVSETELHEAHENYAHEPISYRSYTGATSKVTGEVQLPSIKLEKTAGASKAEVGQPFTWHVVVTNESTVPVKHLQIRDTLPANWEYKAGSATLAKGSISHEEANGSLASGIEQVWEAGALELQPLESDTLTYQATPLIGAETSPGTGPSHPNTNTAYATVQTLAGASEDAHGKFEAGPAQASTTLVIPGLQVTKVASASTVNAGESDSYTVTVDNTGAGVAREVKILDTLPSGMTYQAHSATASPSTGFSELSAAGSSVEWEIASIEAGHSVQITVPVGTEASLTAGTRLTNVVAVHSVEETAPVQAEGTITTTASADVVAHKRVLGNNEAVPGEHLTYEVSATNNGPSLARAVKLLDTLPASVSYVSATSGCTQSAGTVTCEAGDLEPGRTASFQIVVAVTSGATGTIANTVHAESTTPDPEPANNTASVETPTEPSADLKLVKTALASEVLDGQQAEFSLLATDVGPSDAADAKIVDTLPVGLTYVSAEGASCAAAGQEVTCALGTLAAGEQRTVLLVTQPAGIGVYDNSASISSTTPDPEPANNTSEASVQVVPSADLSIEKTVSPTEAGVPGEVTYTLTVANAGPDAAQNVLVKDELPAGESYLASDAGCSVSGQLVTCPLGELPDGSTRTIHLTVKLETSLAEQTVTNTAEVTSTTGDPDPHNNTSSAQIHTGPAPAAPVSPAAPAKPTLASLFPAASTSGKTSSPRSTKLTLSITLRSGAVAPGQPLVYHLTLKNTGTHTAMHPEVCDRLPAQVTVLALHGGRLAHGEVCYRLPTLAAGKHHVFTLVLRANSNARGTILNPATVTAVGVKAVHAHVRRPVHGAVAPHVENAVTG